MLKKLQHKICKWLWQDNDWTHAVDAIERAVKELQRGDKTDICFTWKFLYLPSPNTFKIKITRTGETVTNCNQLH